MTINFLDSPSPVTKNRTDMGKDVSFHLPIAERSRSQPGTGPKDSAANRIFEAAIVLCAEEGFHVTVRDIASLARTNLAAINYYYQSKEGLLQQVIESSVKPIREMMLSQLTAYENFVGGGPLEVADIWTALAAPLVRCSMDESRRYAARARIYTRAALCPDSPGFDSPSRSYSDAVDKRFIKALTLAMPEFSRDAVKWLFYFGLGTILTATRDNYEHSRFRRLSRGACDTANHDQLLKRLVQFLESASSRRSDASQP